MKSDDLERLEESQEMQQLIHAAKEQYEQEKSVHPPVAYAAFAQNLRERQKDGKMKAKQEPPERETFEVKGGKRSGISPWWLVAACLLGGIIDYGISTTSDRQEAGLEILAVADTVIDALCHIQNIAFTCWCTRCAIILALCNSAQAE